MEIANLKVLIVDDDKVIKQMILDFLNMFGAKILTAVNAEEAIDIIKKEEQIDLIISDNDMPPGPSGLDLLGEVKHYYNSVVFVLISGHDIKQEAKMAGANAFLQKPFALSKLKEVIEKL